MVACGLAGVFAGLVQVAGSVAERNLLSTVRTLSALSGTSAQTVGKSGKTFP